MTVRTLHRSTPHPRGAILLRGRPPASGTADHPVARSRAVAVAVLLVAGALPAAAQHLLEVVPVSLDVPDHPRVAYHAAAYASPAFQSWMRSILARTTFYAHHVLEQLEQRGMPAELLFLPAIESSYLGRATSPAGAVGLWQLMRGTAQLHGLIIDDVIDERRDFWKATDVALRILQTDQREFGSWELALAAYNCGAGRVRREVRAAGTRDFWELRRRGRLPSETRDFVPRFYGLVRALRRHPAADSPLLQELYRWRRVTVPDGVELRQLGEISGVSSEILEQANAELNYGLTPAASSGESYLMKVPADSYDRLVAVLEHEADELVRLHRHVIRSGDTMSELAAAFNVSVGLIRRYNAGLNPRRMRVGMGLRIPLVRGVDPAAVELPESRETRPFGADYRVAGGDSLWSIARRYDTTVEALASANGLQPSSILHPGQILQVPRRGEPPGATARA